MTLTNDQLNALDMIVGEVTEFTDHCIDQEHLLGSLTKSNLPFWIFLKCLVEIMKNIQSVEQKEFFIIALNEFVLRES